uniref:Uncharacterized protein n=1 Tax=Aegilops tauschii TaxID=37682 RepID=M8B1B1_AEGTA
MVHAATSERFNGVFASFDRDADGRISAAELRLCMKAALGEDVSAEDARRSWHRPTPMETDCWTSRSSSGWWRGRRQKRRQSGLAVM